MRKKVAMGVLAGLASLPVHGQGTLTLQGEVTKRTADSIVLRVNQSEYRIRRSKLAEDQEREVENANDIITLQVPVEAIQGVRGIHSKSADETR